jgi:MoCo/4Fe-4S cofactor protein with predicted Tat translocation signal
MKTIPPPCPEPAGGRTYWRSLDELAETPEFRLWMEREFPAGASELKDPISRRHFVKIMSSSFLLAGFGLTGCRRPEEKIYPFAKAPDHYVHGESQFFATAMPGRRAALPLLVTSHEGRPHNVAGNPECPGHNGGTDTFAQASLLDLYDPDRATRFRSSGREVSRESAMDHLVQLAASLAETKGQGAWFLMEESSSPSLARIEGLLRQKFPEARWVSYEPVNLSPSFLEKARSRF